MIFCADLKTAGEKYGIKGETRYCFSDAAIACAYAQLSAESLGLSKKDTNNRILLGWII